MTLPRHNRVLNTPPVILILLLLGSHLASADTLVSGTLSGNTTWTPAGNRYIITSSLTISQSAQLRIEPGVVVIVGPGQQIDALGDIFALGTPSNHITFAGVDASNRWDRVNVQARNNTHSIFRWCDFSDAENPLRLYLEQDRLMRTKVYNCTFQRCRWGVFLYAKGIISGGGTLDAIIKNNIFEDCERGCRLFLAWASCSPTIIANRFMNMSEAGVFIGGSGQPSQPIIANNTIVNAARGVRLQNESDALVKNNIISGCGIGVSRETGGDDKNLSVSYNCLYGNATNFWNYPVTYGSVLWTNHNGTGADLSFNIFSDPLFEDTNTFVLASNSPCIDAGDPEDENYTDLCVAVSKGSALVDQGAWGSADACNWLDDVPLLPPIVQIERAVSNLVVRWSGIPRSTYRILHIENLQLTNWMEDAAGDLEADQMVVRHPIVDPPTQQFYYVEHHGRLFLD
jgi:parallel beta-helix repeat protein